jgi:PAS domain S-box-containing protein
MRGGFKSLVLRYGFTLLLFAAVLGLSVIVRYLGLQISLTIPIIVAVVAVAWFAGRGPGILICTLIVVVSVLSLRSTNTSSGPAFYFQNASVLALLVLVVVLVSGRRAAQETARNQSELFLTTLGSIGDAVVTTDAEGRITFINAVAEQLLGITSSDSLGKHLDAVYRLQDEFADEGIEDVFQTVRDQNAVVRLAASHVLLLRPEGSTLPVRHSGAPIIGPQGRFLGSVIVFQDDTPRRESERALKEAEHRQQQSQKLEAIGTLTGGVAHDFNNLLTAIIGYTQLSLLSLETSSPIFENLVNVEKAGNRAAELTKRLLAFSRQQKLESRVIDLNEAIGEMLKLLGRVIGENINVTFKAADSLDQIYADPTQIEQVIMNLSLNARDAMPDGGKLVIETRNVVLDEYYCRQYPTCVPGPYVQVLVSDTGCGIHKDVLDRIFEPFFTTKDVDQGTGLGLSMVYGIVNQHNGHINVYSEIGHGTTFKIYLPIVPDDAINVLRETMASRTGGYVTVVVGVGVDGVG